MSPEQRKTMAAETRVEIARIKLREAKANLKAIKAAAKPKRKRVAKRAAVPSNIRKIGPHTQTMLDMLARKQGATAAEIVKATGWLPHTTRAAVSTSVGRFGHSLVKEKVEGRGLVYRSAAA